MTKVTDETVKGEGRKRKNLAGMGVSNKKIARKAKRKQIENGVITAAKRLKALEEDEKKRPGYSTGETIFVHGPKYPFVDQSGTIVKVFVNGDLKVILETPLHQKGWVKYVKKDDWKSKTPPKPIDVRVTIQK